MNKTLIPIKFFNTFYNGSNHPVSKKRFTMKDGMNCQSYVYKILKYFSINIPNLRSSELWDDIIYTKKIIKPRFLDIVLFNKNKDSYGAHIGLYLVKNKILHLSKKVGYPTIWDLREFN